MGWARAVELSMDRDGRESQGQEECARDHADFDIDCRSDAVVPCGDTR